MAKRKYLSFPHFIKEYGMMNALYMNDGNLDYTEKEELPRCMICKRRVKGYKVKGTKYIVFEQILSYKGMMARDINCYFCCHSDPCFTMACLQLL